MKLYHDPKRNKPSDEGRNEDPELRDDSAIQPGVSTVSSSDTDDEDDEVSKSSSDNFNKKENDKADRTFDEVDYD